MFSTLCGERKNYNGKAEYTRVILDSSSIITASSGGPGFPNSFKFSGFWNSARGDASLEAKYGEKSETKSDAFFDDFREYEGPNKLVNFLNDILGDSSITTDTCLLNSDGSFL